MTKLEPWQYKFTWILTFDLYDSPNLFNVVLTGFFHSLKKEYIYAFFLIHPTVGK